MTIDINTSNNAYLAYAAPFGLAPILWTAKQPFCPH